MSLRRDVLGGLRWTAGTRAVAQIVSWVGTIAVVRILSPDDYGIIAIGGFFILYLLLLSEGGLSEILVRQTSLTTRAYREIQAILLIINGTFCLALAAASPLIASYFSEPLLRQVLPVLAIQFLIVSVAIIPHAALTKAMRFKELSKIMLLQTVLVSSVTLVMAILGFGVWSLVLSNLVGLLFRSTALLVITKRFYWPRFTFRESRAFVGFSGYVLLDRTVWHLFANVDALIVSKTLGTAATGIYSMAQNFASLPLNKISGAVGQVAFPAFSRIQEDGPRMRESYLHAMRVIAVCAFPIGFGLAATADPLVRLVLGEKWIEAVSVFAIIVVSIPFRLLSSFDSPLLLAAGRPKVMLQNRVVSLSVLAPALLVASRWGLNGVAVGWAISAPIIWVLTSIRLCRTFSWPVWGVLRVALFPVLAACLMLLILRAVSETILRVDMSMVLQILVLIPIGVIVYVAAMYVFDRRVVKDVIALLNGMFRG